MNENPEIDTPETSPEMNKATKIFIIIFLIALVAVFSFVFFIKKEAPSPKIVEYNYFKFEEIGGLWQTRVRLDNQEYEGAFRFNPTQVEDVNITGKFSGFKTTPIYITFDPDVAKSQFKYLALASSELSLHIVRGLNYTVSGACTKNLTEACADRPIITCDDENKSVIYISAKPPTQIDLNDNCVKLSGNEIDLLKSVDRLLFQWYKIMK